MGLNHHNKVLQGCFTICGCSLAAHENRQYCCFHVLRVSQEPGNAFVISYAVFCPSFRSEAQEVLKPPHFSMPSSVAPVTTSAV